MTTTPTLDQLKRGLAIAEKIAALEAEMAAIFNGSAQTKTATSTKATPTTGDGRRGKRSAATIAKMKASQQARWAKINGMKPAAASKAPAKAKAPAASNAPAKAKAEAPVKKKRTISPEHRAKLAAAAKARWAAKKK